MCWRSRVKDRSGKPGAERSEVRTCSGWPGPQATPKYLSFILREGRAGAVVDPLARAAAVALSD
ncbi:MAG: hypothetical protein LBU44_01265 [Mediterranea sp.]|nr:hypothetical protein [Mediterranea sp.]